MLKLIGLMLALTARTGRGLLARARPRAGAALRAAKKSTQLTTTNFEAAAASVVAKPQRLPLPAKTRKTVAFNQQYLCAGCGCLLPPEHEIDHIVPVALNGSDALSNLQALCKPCHQQKTRDQRHTILDSIKKEKPVEVEEREVKRVPPLKLNDQQRAAVEASTEPIRVVAGPGTGKTRVLTRRVAHLVESGARASSVLALTFTNRAANELRERLEEEINPQDASSISVGTFHRVCLTMLRDDVEALESPIRKGFAVYDQAAMIKLCMLRRPLSVFIYERRVVSVRDSAGWSLFRFRAVSDRVGAAVARETSFHNAGGRCIAEKPPVGLGWDKAEIKPARVQSAISSLKNAGFDATSYADLTKEGYGDRIVSRVFDLYEKTLQQRNAVDFDDMLSLTARLLEHSPETRQKYAGRWKHVLVDEFQDTNGVQYDVLKLLASSSVFVVGDSDQAIYGWRGADFENQQRYDDDFGARLLKLERNYRSAQPILSAASAVVESTTRRRDMLTLEGREGSLVPSIVELEDQDDEARWIADVCVRAEGDVAVLYRTNAQSRAVERELLKAGVSYQLLHAKGFFERKEIRDVLAYLRLLAYPKDDDAFERVANVPPRAVGPRSLERLRVQALEGGEGMLHAAAHAKDPVPKRAASNLKVFTDALDELRELQEATPSPVPAEEGHAGPLVGSMAWFLLEVLVCCSVPCAFDLFVAPRGDGVVCASLRRHRATPSTRRHRRAANAGPHGLRALPAA
jgi:superfamily I DNA/RNA helicase/5-methylcytosine-specific restriction endonuclease McrA